MNKATQHLWGAKANICLSTPLPLAYFQDTEAVKFKVECIQAMMMSESAGGFFVRVLNIKNVRGQTCELKQNHLFLPYQKIDSMQVELSDD